jgi:hypothetical protein
MQNVTHKNNPVHYSCVIRTTGLIFLLSYARLHTHSKQWVPPLLTLLARTGVARG